jgi:hypothetical protein
MAEPTGPATSDMTDRKGVVSPEELAEVRAKILALIG